jgi:hypothetical protein
MLISAVAQQHPSYKNTPNSPPHFRKILGYLNLINFPNEAIPSPNLPALAPVFDPFHPTIEKQRPAKCLARARHP